MNLASLPTWLALDGHGVWVWSTTTLVAFCLAAELWLLRRRRLRALALSDAAGRARRDEHAEDPQRARREEAR